MPRPLRMLELQYAVSIEPGDKDLDEEALPDEDYLLSVCAGLVTVDVQSSVIRLVHYTAQECFERNGDNLFPNAETELAATCMTYVSFDVIDVMGFWQSFWENQSTPDHLTRLSDVAGNTFLDHAAEFWDSCTQSISTGTTSQITRFPRSNVERPFLFTVERSPGNRCSAPVLWP